MPELSLFATDAISRVGIYDQIKSLSITRKLRRPSTFRLELATQVPRYEEITKGRYVGLSDIATATINRIMRIDQLERSTESDSVIVTGRDFAGAFDSRICTPPVGQSHHTFTAQKAETIIKTLVSFNAGPTATPARVLPNLVIEADSARGATITTQARYQALSDMLEEVLTFDGGGYEVLYVTGPTNMHQFRYIAPTDRSASVFFDLEFESVSSQNWIQSDIDMRNALYVGGQGEGVNRLIVGVGPVTSGLDRREAFVDARDLSTVDAVTARGNAILEQMIEDNRFTATLYERGSFRYGTHFFLGDIVTLQNRKWNLNVQSRVISATLTWTDTEQPAITLELDRPWPTIKERMQQEAYGLSQVSPKGAVDYHSENHAARHQPGGADLLVLNPSVYSGINLNDTAIPTGFYSFVNPTGAPGAQVYWHIIVNRWPDPQGYTFQLASPILDPAKLFYRGYNVSTLTWSPWAEIAGAQNKMWQTMAAAFTSTVTWGTQQSRMWEISNFNYFGPAGMYHVDNLPNAPKAGHIWTLLHMVWGNHQSYTNNYITQIASSLLTSGETYIRTCANGTWGTWSKILTSGNSGTWVTYGVVYIPAQAQVWDIMIPNSAVAAGSINALRFECTFYPNVALNPGGVYFQPWKLNTPFLHGANMSCTVTKFKTGVAPSTTGYNESNTGYIGINGAVSAYAGDYGHHFDIEFSDTNNYGLMTWKSFLTTKDVSAATPETHIGTGEQRGAHVYGPMTGLRVWTDQQFNTGTYARISGRKTETYVD